MMASLIGAILNRSPIPLSSSYGSGIPFFQNSRASDTKAQLEAMSSVGTLFSIVNLLAESTAAVEWHLYRKRGTRANSKQERVEVTNHAALNLLNKPNKFMTRSEFIEASQQHVDLTGESEWVLGYSSISRAVGPIEMWPIRPDRMTPIPHPVDFLHGWIYSSPDGEKVPLDLDEVIQLRMPNPMDMYRGLGPVQSVFVDLDSSRYSKEWNRNFFINSAQPGGVIELPNELDDEQWTAFQLRWREQHRGVAQAHRVAVLEGGAIYKPTTFTQKDMQFTELSAMSRDAIREAFRVPKFALGDVNDVNRATAQASANWFAANLTVPRLERFKQALNNDLLPLFGAAGEAVEFDYDSPVKEDKEIEEATLTNNVKNAIALIDAGFDPDEVLEFLQLPGLTYKAPVALLPIIPGGEEDEQEPVSDSPTGS